MKGPLQCSLYTTEMNRKEESRTTDNVTEIIFFCSQLRKTLFTFSLPEENKVCTHALCETCIHCFHRLKTQNTRLLKQVAN